MEYSLSVLQIDFWCDGSTLTELDSSRIKLVQQHFQKPLIVTCRIFSKCLANQLRVSRVNLNLEESFNSSQIDLTSGRTIRKLPLTNCSGLGVLDNLHNIKQTSDGNERKV